MLYFCETSKVKAESFHFDHIFIVVFQIYSSMHQSVFPQKPPDGTVRNI